MYNTGYCASQSHKHIEGWEVAIRVYKYIKYILCKVYCRSFIAWEHRRIQFNLYSLETFSIFFWRNKFNYDIRFGSIVPNFGLIYITYIIHIKFRFFFLFSVSQLVNWRELGMESQCYRLRFPSHWNGVLWIKTFSIYGNTVIPCFAYHHLICNAFEPFGRLFVVYNACSNIQTQCYNLYSSFLLNHSVIRCLCAQYSLSLFFSLLLQNEPINNILWWISEWATISFGFWTETTISHNHFDYFVNISMMLWSLLWLFNCLAFVYKIGL